MTDPGSKSDDDSRRSETCPWHALGADAVLARLDARPAGLDEAEAQRRFAAHGPNLLPRPRPASAFLRFARQFHNVLIYVLLASAAVTAGLAHWVDTGVILAVVLINAGVGFVQEGKAQRAMEAVQDMLSLRAVVVRDGVRQEVDAAILVPGDVVFVQPGDKVPADLRLLRAKSLRVVEAALTGESVPVDKSGKPMAADSPLAERVSMAYAGTVIAAGQATGIVVATGQATEIGRVSAMLARTVTLETPLTVQLAVMGRWLTAAVLVLAAATFAVGAMFRSMPTADMFMAAVGLTVAAIPEGLPAMITIALAIGVERMARRNAIIRRLPAVETLGSVTVICTDKTGTLTRNELTVRELYTPGQRFEASGVGYDPAGEIRRCDGRADAAHAPELRSLLRAGALCNDAELRHADGAWTLAGDPTEGALLVVALKAGMDQRGECAAAPRLDEVPFDAAHRFMATLHRERDGPVVYLKGAPEAVLDLCETESTADGPRPIGLPAWRRSVEEAAAAGRRVLALAVKPLPADRQSISMADMRDGFMLLGLIAMIDPPRAEAVAAVRECRRAGIRVAMITGDHAATALAIARELGIESPRALTGRDIDAMGDAELADALRDTTVFARADPAHKLRLVQGLQADGEVVAMTGDGVNDAPALKRADVGVAMGRKGTEAAREAAEMVLADDNFASIAHAVREGRAIYDNLRKTMMFILPTNAAEALMIAIAILIGVVLPITPVQIMWVNLVTAVTLSLALAFEAAEDDVMDRTPRPPREPMLTPFVLWRAGFAAFLILTASFGLFGWYVRNEAGMDLARTVTVNALVACEAFYLLSARFVIAPALCRRALVGSGPAALAIGLTGLCQIAFTYLPAAQAVFDTVPLGAADWGPILAAGLFVLIAVELEKLAIRRFSARGRDAHPASR